MVERAYVAVAYNRKICSSGRWKNIHTEVATCLKQKAKCHFLQTSADSYEAHQIPLPWMKWCSTVASGNRLFSDYLSLRSKSFGTMFTSKNHLVSNKGRVWAHPTLYTLSSDGSFPLRLPLYLSKASRTKSQPGTKPIRSVPWAIHPMYLLPFAVPLVHPLTM